MKILITGSNGQLGTELQQLLVDSPHHDVLGVDRKSIAGWLWMKSEEVVADSLAALDRGKWLVIPGWFYRAFVAVISKLPVALRVAFESRNPQRRGRGPR